MTAGEQAAVSVATVVGVVLLLYIGIAAYRWLKGKDGSPKRAGRNPRRRLNRFCPMRSAPPRPNAGQLNAGRGNLDAGRGNLNAEQPNAGRGNLNAEQPNAGRGYLNAGRGYVNAGQGYLNAGQGNLNHSIETGSPDNEGMLPVRVNTPYPR